MPRAAAISSVCRRSEILAAHGRTFSVLASNSAGATRILNQKVGTLVR